MKHSQPEPLDALPAPLARSDVFDAMHVAFLNAIDSVDEGDGEAAMDGFLGRLLQAITSLLDLPSAVLWVHDQAETLTRVRLMVRGGNILRATDSGHATLVTPLRKTSDLWDVHQKRSPHIGLVEEGENFSADQVRQLLSEGVGAILALPLIVGKRSLGSITVRIPRGRTLRAAEAASAQVVADQVSLALHLARLTEEAKAAAVLKEREHAAQMRIAELAKANDALAKAIAKLSAEDDIDAYLGELLAILLEQMGEDSGTFWRLAEDGSFRLDAEVVSDALKPISKSKHPGAPHGIDKSKRGGRIATQVFVAMSVDRQPLVISDISSHGVYDDDEESRQYLLKLGVRAQLIVPLFSGRQHLGSFSIRSRRLRSWTAEQVELAQSLGNQAALAIEMKRLIEKEREIAVVTEQARAAQEQIVELERANAAISRTIDALAQEKSVDAFLSTTMASIAEALQSPSLTMWLFRDGLSHLHLVHSNGRTVHGELSDHPNARQPVPMADNLLHLDESGRLRRAPFLYSVGADGAPWTPEQVQYLRKLGVRALVEGVMVVEDRVIGVFTARLLVGQPDPTPARLSLVQSLTNQAALALEMARLSEEAERAANAVGQVDALTRANQAMNASLSTLTNAGELDALLGQVLRTVVERLGEQSGGLWLFEPDGVKNYLHLSLEEGVLHTADSTKHPARQHSRTHTSHHTHQGRVSRLQSRTPLLDGPHEIATGSDYEPFRAYLAENGIKSILTIPLFAGDSLLGSISVRGKKEAFLPEEVAFAQALASQASLALHVARLAEEAKQLAIAREQQEAAMHRAETLARANLALSSTLDRLAEEQDLHAFLRESVVVFAREMGAVGAGIWLNSADSPPYLVMTFEDGEVRAPERSPHPGKDSGERDSDRDALARGEIVLYSGDALRARRWYSQFRDYLEARGIIAIAAVPIFIGGRCAGNVVLRHTHVPEYSREQTELALAMANQIALALELTRLADAAQQAAIAREQKEAAVHRAETLARANLALSSTLDRLAEEQDLRAFLKESVVVFAREMSAVGAGIWLNRNDQSSEIVMTFEDGEVRSPERSPHPGTRSATDSTDETDKWHLDRGEIIVLSGESLRARSWYPTFRDYLESRGIVAVASVPIFVGSHWAGTVVLRHTVVPEYSREQTELALAMSNQIALALELTRLADAAQQAAIAHERELAAHDRAAKLAKANDALRRSSARLVSLDNLTDYLGEVVRSAIEVSGAVGGSVAMLSEDGERLAIGPVFQDSDTDGAIQQVELPPTFVELKGDSLLAWQHVSGAAGYWWATPDSPGFHEAARAHHRARGHLRIAHVPIRLRERVVGALGLAFREEISPSSGRLEMLGVLAEQASLAIGMTRLAEEARQAAISKAQEQAAQMRAAELARANQAMRESLDQIVHATDLEQLRPTVLRALIDLLGAVGGTLWTYDGADDSLTLDQEFWHGHLVSKGEVGFARHVRRSYSPEHPAAYESHGQLISGRTLTIDTDTSLAAEFDDVEPLKAEGIRTLIVIPLAAAGKHLGRFTLTFNTPRRLTAVESEMVNALANQASLIMETTRLSREARLSAIAQERERAAQVRVGQLVTANAALTRAIDVLATEPAVDAMLSHTLHSVCDQLAGEGASGSLWLIDPALRTQRLHLVYQDGIVVFGRQSDHPSANRPEPVDGAKFDGPHPRGEHRLVDVEKCPHHHQDYLKRLGVQRVLSLPMTFAAQAVGVFVVNFGSVSSPPTAESLELAQALVQQATLAVQMSHLARRAEEEAVARETANAARSRAEALAGMGVAVSASLEKLAERLDLFGFLEQVLSLCVGQVGADAGGLWLWDSARGHDRLVLELEAGAVRRLPELAVLAAQEPPEEIADVGAFGPGHAPGVVTLHGRNELAQLPDYEPHRERLLSSGVQAVLVVPIYLKHRYRGRMTMRFRGAFRVAPEQEALALALANQAAVAMELSNLAEAERSSAVVGERNRLAREIHDSLAQAFTGIVLQLQAAGGVAKANESTAAFIDNAMHLARSGLAEARRSVMALRPLATERNGLTVALKQLANSASISGGVQCEFIETSAPRAISPYLEDALYRVAQEAVQNAQKHARATRIVILLSTSDETVTLSIEDDGVGMAESVLGQERSSGGLHNMATRMAQVGGHFDVQQVLPHGTLIEVSAPLGPGAISDATNNSWVPRPRSATTPREEA